VCVLTDIKNNLEFGDLLGKGAFAQVHTCTRKGLVEKMALKSIKKKMLKENRRNLKNLL